VPLKVSEEMAEDAAGRYLVKLPTSAAQRDRRELQSLPQVLTTCMHDRAELITDQALGFPDSLVDILDENSAVA